MKFKYKVHKKSGRPANLEEFPLLEVELAYKRNRVKVDCMVDSGASESLFTTDIVDLLGIDLSNARPQEYEGIGRGTIVGFRREIRLHITGFPASEWIKIKAGFIEDDMPIIGQEGFFDNYEVTFRKFKKSFEIKNRSRTRRPRN